MNFESVKHEINVWFVGDKLVRDEVWTCQPVGEPSRRMTEIEIAWAKQFLSKKTPRSA